MADFERPVAVGRALRGDALRGSVNATFNALRARLEENEPRVALHAMNVRTGGCAGAALPSWLQALTSPRPGCGDAHQELRAARARVCGSPDVFEADRGPRHREKGGTRAACAGIRAY